MSRRTSDFDLLTAIADPGFTPSRRDVPALLEVLATAPAEAREHAERALRRAGAPALEAAMVRAKDAPAGARARLVGLVGRMGGGDARTRAFLLESLAAPDAGVRRRAADGLGRTTAEGTIEEVSAALAGALTREGDAATRAAIVAALGKVGGEAASAALGALQSGEAGGGNALDARTEAELRKARVRAARLPAREGASGIDIARPLELPARVWLECRRGLLPVLLEEAAALEPRTVHRLDGSAVAEVRVATLQRLFASRTWLSASLPGEVVRIAQAGRAQVRSGRAPAQRGKAPGEGDRTLAAARALASGQAHDTAAALTRGPLRYRIAWASGGKRRAEVYRLAEAAAAIDPALVNDPSEAPWEIRIHETEDAVAAEWVPALADPRFAYRHGDVPAASNPTIAAALAFLAGVREGDVVWDPFVGSGLELCERAQLGPYRSLAGTDVEPAALDVARANLTACGAEGFTLSVHDVARGAPRGVRPTLVITNPPMGRRVHRKGDLRSLLRAFVATVARALAPDGRFVWVSPFPADSRAAATAAGLHARRGHTVDMGGFEAEIQLFTAQ